MAEGVLDYIGRASARIYDFYRTNQKANTIVNTGLVYGAGKGLAEIVGVGSRDLENIIDMVTPMAAAFYANVRVNQDSTVANHRYTTKQILGTLIWGLAGYDTSRILVDNVGQHDSRLFQSIAHIYETLFKKLHINPKLAGAAMGSAGFALPKIAKYARAHLARIRAGRSAPSP